MTEDTAVRPELRTPRFGLSGKLLVLTILFVMIAEVLIYVPSVANFRVVWLKDRLATAYTAALVLDAAPNGVVSDNLAKRILELIGARAVAMKMGSRHRMIAVDDMPPAVAATYDMRNVYAFDAVVDAFTTMLNSKKDVVRVMGPAPGGEYIELVMDEQPLRRAMLRYSVDILLLSLLISAITAALVYLALHYMFVRPMRRVTGNMVAFRADPENSDRVIVPIRTARRDRHRRARTRDDADRARLDAASEKPPGRPRARGVKDQSRPAQSARLGAIVLRSARKNSRSRRATVCTEADACARTRHRLLPIDTIYGRLQEPPPDRRPIQLEPLVEEVHETLGSRADAPIRWISAVERGLVVEADYDQLFRIMLNLSRNAVQAMESQAAESRTDRDPGRDQICITGRREGAVVVIEVEKVRSANFWCQKRKRYSRERMSWGSFCFLK